MDKVNLNGISNFNTRNFEKSHSTIRLYPIKAHDEELSNIFGREIVSIRYVDRDTYVALTGYFPEEVGEDYLIRDKHMYLYKD